MHMSTNMAGTTMAFPDVCLTPAPPAPNPVPIPYPNVGQCATAMANTCAVKVKILNKNVLTIKSKVMSTQGDQAGVNGGVTSGMFGGPCARTQSSMKVLVEGSPAVRNLDLIGSNGTSPNAPVGNQLAPSQTIVLCLG
ncbi:MAG: PAAR-like domain-containing protein [Sandaracinaceae bacterium]